MVQVQQVLAMLHAATECQSPAELERVYARVKELALTSSNVGTEEFSFATQTLVKCAEAALLLSSGLHSSPPPGTARIGNGSAVDLTWLCSESLSLYFTLIAGNSQSAPSGQSAPSATKNAPPASTTQDNFTVRDQFLCRAYYAQAQLADARCKGLKGSQLREELLAAAELVLRGVRLAQELGSRHAFLVYNGSVHHWRITRVLNRPGARAVLLPSFDTITKSLEWATTQGVQQEEWRAHNLLALAWCLADGGNKERAVAVAQECEKLAKGGELLAAAAALRVHLTVSGKSGGGSGKAKGDLGKDAEGQARALLQIVRSSFAPSQSPPESKPPDKKRPPSSQSLSSDAGELEKQILEAWRLADPGGASLVASPSPTPDQVKAAADSIKGVNTDLVADVAWTSAIVGIERVAEKAAGRAAQGKTLSGRARAELALCKIALDKESSHLLSDAAPDPSATARRADVIRRAEGSLSSFLRAGDCAGVEDTCQLIWNAALPLVDPPRRHVAARALRSAASALETVGSGMHRLRAQIHLELAELHQGEEMLSKAEDEAKRGFDLDYEAAPAEVDSAGCERPLDLHFEPLLKRMKLKRDIYSDPDRPMDKALMFVEQAREAKKAVVKADLLGKAAAELTAAETEERAELARIEEEERGRKSRAEAAAHAAAAEGSTPEPGSKGSKSVKGKGGKESASKGRETPSNEGTPEPSQKGATFVEERFRQVAKERARLWAGVVKAAVEAKLWALAHFHTDQVLATEWDVNRDRDMVLLQADVAFLDAEACAGVLREKGLELLPPSEAEKGKEGAPADTVADVGSLGKPEDASAVSSGTPGGSLGDRTEGDSTAKNVDHGGSGRLESHSSASSSSAEEAFNERAFQERAYEGFLEGARRGLALNEAWLVTNAAASLWNNYLPLLKGKRFAPTVAVFQPMLDGLLTLPVTVAVKDAVTVSGIANALACGHVHKCLDRLYRVSVSGQESPAVAGTEGAEPPAADKAKGVRSPSPNPKLRKTDTKKERATAAPEKVSTEIKSTDEASATKPLGADSQNAVSQNAVSTDVPSAEQPKAADAQTGEKIYTELLAWALESGRKRCENAPELVAAAEVCSKVLEKLAGVDESVLKVLVGTQAKVQGLRGLQAQAQGDQTLGASAKAVALIELASNTAESAGVRAKAVSVAAEALQKGDGKEAKGGGVELELWTKLAQGSLALGDLQRAISCCRSARGLADQLGGKGPPADKENVPQKAAPSNPKTLAPYHYYWLSLAEAAEGQATSLLINPARQSPAAQDALRVKALERFLEAAKCGAKAGRTDLMCRAAVLWWNAALPLTKDAPGRSLLAATCQALLEALLAARVRALAPDMHASLFLVLLDCLAEQERWEEGLKWTDLAVRNTAPAQHKKFWAVKTKFMVKMGRNMSEELERMQDTDGEVRARMWATLAAQSDDAFERLTAHQRAIEAQEEVPWLQVPYMISYAEYLASQGYPSTDSEDVLLCAGDILHDLEEEEDEDEQNDGEVGHQSRAGGGSMASGSKQSRQRAGSTVGSSRPGGGSVAGRSAIGGGSLRGSQHGSVRPSQAPTMKTLGSRRDGGSQAGGSRKGSVTGKSTAKSGVTSASASDPSLSLPESKRLQDLLRIYTLLAKTSTNLEERRENALLAHHFGVRLFKHVLGEVNGHVAEKRAALAEVASLASNEESRMSRSLSKAVGSAVTVRPSRLGGSLSSATPASLNVEQPPPIVVPSSPQEWTRVDLVEQVKAGIRLEKELEGDLVKAVKGLGLSGPAKSGGSKNKINGSDLHRQLAKKIKGLDLLLQDGGPGPTRDPIREAIDDPTGILATLGSLEDYLDQAGLHLHALPLRQLALIIADVVMARADAVLGQKLAMVKLLADLALGREAAEWTNSLGVLAIDPEERRKAREEIEQRMEAKRLAAAKMPAEYGADSLKSAGALLLNTSKQGAPMNLRERNGNVDNGTTIGRKETVTVGEKGGGKTEKNWGGKVHSSMNESTLSRPKAQPFHARHAWLAAGAFLATRGRLQGARSFLTEARAHAQAFDDDACSAACALHLARFTLLENKHSEAMSLIQEVVSIAGDFSEWVERAVAAGKIWLEELPRGSGFHKARALLKAGIGRFSALARSAHQDVSGKACLDSAPGADPCTRNGNALDAGIAEARLMMELAAVVTSESHHSLRVGDKNRAEKTAREAVGILRTCCDRWRDLGGGAASLAASLAHVAALDWLLHQETPESPTSRPQSRVDQTDEDSARTRARRKGTFEMQKRVLLDALEEGRRLLQTSKPPGTSAMPSAPLARHVAQVLEGLARAELALAAVAVADAEHSVPGSVPFPLVEGRNAEPVRKFLEETEEIGPAAVQRRRDANREQSHEEKATLYTSEALSLLGDNPDLCHVASILHSTLGTCLLGHSAREAALEEKNQRMRRKNEEIRESHKGAPDGLSETGPSWPMDIPQTEDTGIQPREIETPPSSEQQGAEVEMAPGPPLGNTDEKTDSTPTSGPEVADHLPVEKMEDRSAAKVTEHVYILERQGVAALETAITIGLRESRYEVVSEAAAQLADFYSEKARKGFKDLDAKCARFLALSQGCKARASLMGTLETACARDDAQVLAMRWLECVKSGGKRFSCWPEVPFSDFCTVEPRTDDVDVTSAESAVAKASPCAWGVLESVKNQSFGDAVSRLPADCAALILHLDEKRNVLFAVCIGPMPTESGSIHLGEKGKGGDAKGGADSKRRTSKNASGKEKRAVVPQKEDAAAKLESAPAKAAEPTKKERSILVEMMDLGVGAQRLSNLLKGFEVWRAQAKRMVARAHVAPTNDRKDDDIADAAGEAARKTDMKQSVESKAKGKEPPKIAPAIVPGESKLGQGGAVKGARASSRMGRASKAPSRPVSRLERRPLDAELEDRWTALIVEMGELFQPLKAVFEAAAGCGMSTDSIEGGLERSESRQSQKSDAPIQSAALAAASTPRQLVLFPDSVLAPLPLEALPEFRSPSDLSISRDFSLAIFAHRIARAAASQTTQTSQTPPKLDLRRLCYIVDPQNEDTARATRLPTRVTPPLAEAFSEITQSLAGGFSAKEWKGLLGADHVPSDGEIQRLVSNSSGLIFVGLGRLLASVGASALAALDLGGCQLALLAEMSVSEESLRRQAFLDNRKSHEAKELERPHTTAALLTLCGVSSIAVNQAVSTVDANHAVVTGLIHSLTSQPSVTVGEALKEASSKMDATELRSLSTNMVLYGLPMLGP